MIRLAREDELDDIAALVESQQKRIEERIAYFGDTQGEVEALLASWDPSWAETSVVAERDESLVGFLGAELDDSLGRAWLHGPVAAANWDDIADALLAVMHDEVPRVVGKEQELAGDVANTQLATFAARHGFVAGNVHHVLELPAAEIDLLTALAVPTVDATHADAFTRLHEELFPGTYYSGSQLLDLAERGEATVLGLVEDGELIGYAAGRIDEAGNGYVDFVGVIPNRRRRGHGAALVASISRALAARARVPKIVLTVSSENEGALALYERLGFTRASSAVGYRRAAGQQG